MKLFYRNAAATLFEKVHSLSDYHNSWRCIHLKLSRKRERYNQQLLIYFVIKGIAEILANDDGYIYLCRDGDIFILFQGLMGPVLDKLGDHFADIDPDNAPDEAGSRFMTIYDLSRDWNLFFNLCYTKSRCMNLLNEAPDYSWYHYAGKEMAEGLGEA